MKRKMLATVLAMVMTMAMVAGCGGAKEEAAAPAETTEASETAEVHLAKRDI